MPMRSRQFPQDRSLVARRTAKVFISEVSATLM
jgi:hypothetical protein